MGAAKQFVRAALDLQAKQNMVFVALGQRFEKVDLSKVLIPEHLTTPAGIEAARAIVAEYRGLLAERKTTLQTQIAESEKFIGSQTHLGTTWNTARVTMAIVDPHFETVTTG